LSSLPDQYQKELYQIPAVRATVDHHHIKHHYMESHKSINPLGIVSVGPDLAELDIPHDRETKFPAKK
jgi:putative glutathione S-transferase